MDDATRRDNRIGDKAEDRRLVTDSDKIVIQAGKVMIEAAEQAVSEKRDPAKMLRVLSLLAAPVYDPRSPEQAPVHLDLRQEWHVLADGIRRSGAPILLAKLTPPTLPALRSALSPRAKEQNAFPHVLHFSGHAWSGGLVLEDDLGQVHHASCAEILKALEGLPKKLDLVVLNGCESAEDAGSVAQALVDGGLTRAVVGHEKSVYDDEAVAFASRLYVELTGGFTLGDAWERASKEITTHEVILLGEKELRFEGLSGGEPRIEDHSPRCSLPAHGGIFLGRGREIVQIGQALAHPPAVVVLSGPPGIGKSSLVTEAANRNFWRFSGGVAYAAGPRPDEGSKATATEMLTALAEGLEQAKAEDLALYTIARPTLLLLDNLESLADEEMDRLKDFLRKLGEESAAIIAMRPSCEALEELPSASPGQLHR
ncbi:MAG: CHAT domain-containing protein, partial [Methanothrix sp.]|nr:CHAT domain-containing protein [Methanothrix sp.]